MIFAAAPSQEEFLAALCRQENIDWSRIHAFHMDEYVQLPDEAPQRFGNFLKERSLLLQGQVVDAFDGCDHVVIFE